MQESASRTGDALSAATIRREEGSFVQQISFHGGELSFPAADEVVISTGITTNFSLDYVALLGRGNVVPVIGRFCVLPPQEQLKAYLRGDCEVLQVVLPTSVVEDWLQEDWGIDRSKIEILPGHGIDDAELSRLIWLARQAGAQYETTPLRAIIARLYRKLANTQRHLRVCRGGLSPAALRKVMDMVEDKLDGPITVESLARRVCLSPFHFAHQFQVAVGQAPHQFIVDRRLSRAINLISKTSLSVSEIAACTGFSHTSHLSRHLKRKTHLTPSELRRLTRS